MKPPLILLVEDNPGDVVLTERALRKNNIANELAIVTDGQEALDFVFAQGKYSSRDPKDRPCLILLDAKLPKIDGMEVLRYLREDERTKLVPVVMLTSSKEEDDVVSAYRLGANSYIRKPVDFNGFADAMKLIGMYWLILNEPLPETRD